MKRWFSFVLVALLALTVACCPPKSPGTFVHTLDEETVELVRGEDHATFCAAVWVSDTYLLTAGHCAEVFGKSDVDMFLHQFAPEEFPSTSPVGQAAEYRTFDDAFLDVPVPRKAWVIAYDEENDLALLRAVKPAPHPYAHLAYLRAMPGDEANVVGHPVGLGWTFSRGYVAGQRGSVGERGPRMQVSAPIYPGNSGGGAFDANGDLIGIASFKIRGMDDLGFFIGQDLIRAFLLGRVPV